MQGIHRWRTQDAQDDTEMKLFEDNMNGALFSECGKHRYRLWRIWDDSKPKVMFIGLNPSTANASTDDATIRTVKGFAKRWGFGGVYMLNLFPFITPYPNELQLTGMDDNDRHLIECSQICSTVVFAWGSFPVARDRAAQVSSMFENPMALKVNANGTPHHPLYLPLTTELVPFPR
jgi:hypothetical protein